MVILEHLENGNAIAIATVGLNPQGIFYLSYFYVDISRRGEGVGTKLLARVNTVLNQTRVIGKTDIPRSERVQRFYEKNGWVKIPLSNTMRYTPQND